MLQHQAGSFRKKVFKDHIEAGRNTPYERVGQSPQQGWLAMAQEFVENQYLTARLEYSGDLGETTGRLRDDGEYQMQYRSIETAVGKRQALCVTTYGQEIKLSNTWQGATQHGLIQIQANVMMLGREVREVESSADAGQQYATGSYGQS